MAKLKAAGAVILGKTNLLEYAYGAVHPDFGQTNNPWDYKRTSGGSSGGSAAPWPRECVMRRLEQIPAARSAFLPPIAASWD